jgi:biopolymer transport protein ExbD
MNLKKERERKARIEMVPLIDMIFLLLVFFIYAMLSMAVHRSLPVSLPQSSTVTIDKSQILSVTIDREGGLSVDKTPVPMDALAALLREKSAHQTEPGILLFADKRLPYQKLVTVLDRIREAGIERISLQAEAEKED